MALVHMIPIYLLFLILEKSKLFIGIERVH
jgi:hypothetical protein